MLGKGFFFTESHNPDLPPEEWTEVSTHTTAGAYSDSLTWGKYKIILSGAGGGGAAAGWSEASGTRYAANGYKGEEKTIYVNVDYGNTLAISGIIGAGGGGAAARIRHTNYNYAGSGGTGYQNGSSGTITQKSSEDDFTNWYPLLRFILRDADKLDLWEYKDFTIQHGLRYQYAIQQYNSKGLYSTKMIAVNEKGQKYIEPDFEDSFLYDGKRQLKIRFNPKVSSFKTDLMENKVDTIGSKYPFIFRNSKVEYKEFPIAGLISYHSDEANLFIDDEKLGLETDYTQKPRSEISRTKAIETNDLYLKARTTALVGYNVAAERIFKLSVLEWLNDGKPKLFRSPTEGNYFVRLMNVSLTPEEVTGRMIHTFQATAYEIAPCDYSTLNQYEIISIDEPSSDQYRLMTLDLSDPDVKDYYAESSWGEEEIREQQAAQAAIIARLQQQLTQAENQLYAATSRYDNNPTEENWDRLEAAHRKIVNLNNQIIAASREAARLATLTTYKKYNKHDMIEYIEFRDCLPGTTFYIFDENDGTEFSITIGVTGSYIVSLDDHVFTSVRVADNADEPAFGLITYKYLAVEENNFENIYDIEYEQTLARQFIGKKVIIDKSLPKDEINDIKRTLISFYYINFQARIVEDIYVDGDGVCWKWKKTGNTITQRKGNKINNDALSPFMIYKIHDDLNIWHYAEWKDDLNEWHTINEIDYTITIDDNIIVLEPDYEEELLNHLIQFFDNQSFDYLRIGNGIVLDCAYTSSLSVYNIEMTDNELQSRMRSYLNMVEMYNTPDSQYYQSRTFYDTNIVPAWTSYCNLLKQKLDV